MNELLTDDEVLALAGLESKDWPLPLLTIGEPTEANLRLAAFRGMRTLTIRRLVKTPEGGHEAEVNPALRDKVVRILGASKVVLAHVSPPDRVALGGAAVVAFQSGEEWVIDSLAANGVHALSVVDKDGALSIMNEFIQLANDSVSPGMRGESCVVASSNSGLNAVRVMPGKAQVGAIVGSPSTPRFEASAQGVLSPDQLFKFLSTLFAA